MLRYGLGQLLPNMSSNFNYFEATDGNHDPFRETKINSVTNY